MSNQDTKVIVGLSGGVDSSVAAWQLLQQGYQVEGLFMKNWEEDDTDSFCSAEQDLKDVEAVSRILDIPYRTINFSTEYWDRVFEYFLSEYRAGRTPNPDVLCNREIKFKAFLDHALDQGAQYIATGHYARCRHLDHETQLLKGVDSNKDQSYFLVLLNQHQLQHTLFPVGELDKTEVRNIAKKLDLPNHDKKDSTGICFIGERPFREFLQTWLPAQPGNMVTPEGKLMGTHQGLMYYTIGQRQGLGIGGTCTGSEEPWYVVDKLLDTNELVVAQGNNHPLLFRQALEATQVHWINGRQPASEFDCTAKTRYRQSDQTCHVEMIDNDNMRIRFDQAQRAVTPGQYVVLYDDDVCLGGGVITGKQC